VIADALGAALRYAELGFKVIPARGKRPWLDDWPSKATTDAAAITEWWREYPEANVGIAPDGSFAVLDVDSAKGGDATLAALEREHGPLPETVKSRTGGGGTHAYYRVEPSRSLRYQPGKGVEILGAGRQAIEWPSIHPDTGARYVWIEGHALGERVMAEAPEWFYRPAAAQHRKSNGSAQPPGAGGHARIERYCRAALEKECAALAHQTQPGRNNALNTAALKLGALAHYRVYSEATARAELCTACMKNSYIADEGMPAFEATFASGWRAGLDSPRKIPEREQADDGRRNHNSDARRANGSAPDHEVDDAIAELSATHFVTLEGGKAVVVRQERDPVFGRHVLQRMGKRDLSLLLANKRVRVIDKHGNAVMAPLAKVWIEHPDRPTYQGVVFAPEGAHADYFNLWRGWAVEPRAGDWSLMQEHIRDVICGGDETLFNFWIGWHALLVKQPTTRPEVALVLRGDKGAGKGLAARAIAPALGAHFLPLTQSRHLLGHFNAHLEDALLVYADESFWAGDRQGESVLKGMITEPEIVIERKGQNPKVARNLVHLVMSANAQWVIPATRDERRFCVFDVSPKRIGDRAYFRALIAQHFDRGGAAAMLHDLLRYDLSSFEVRTVPDTEGLREQKVRSFDVVTSFWADALREGSFPPDVVADEPASDDWPERVRIAALHHAYEEYARKRHEHRVLPENLFSRELRRLQPKDAFKVIRPYLSICDATGVVRRRRCRCYVLRTLDEHRDAFEKAVGGLPHNFWLD
jgi:hypothetical protein